MTTQQTNAEKLRRINEALARCPDAYGCIRNHRAKVGKYLCDMHYPLPELLLAPRVTIYIREWWLIPRWRRIWLEHCTDETVSDLLDYLSGPILRDYHEWQVRNDARARAGLEA